jgi:S1-C subfamily serine protease
LDTLRVDDEPSPSATPSLDQTVTVGVVSATGRADVGFELRELRPDGRVDQSRQLRRAVVNLRGEVIGINTAIVATGQCIGFAIPANMARRILTALERGEVTRLARRVDAAAHARAGALGLPSARGAVVARVSPGVRRRCRLSRTT